MVCFPHTGLWTLEGFPPSELPPMVFLLSFSFLWGPHNLSFLPKPSSDLAHPFSHRGAHFLPGPFFEGAHALLLAILPQWPAACSVDAFLCLPGRPVPPRLAQAGPAGILWRDFWEGPNKALCNEKRVQCGLIENRVWGEILDVSFCPLHTVAVSKQGRTC